MTDSERLSEIERRLSDLERRLLCEDTPRLNHPGRPTALEVHVHFRQCGRTDDAADWQGFFDHYDAVDWISGTGQPITNWKAKAGEWLRRNPKPAPVEEPAVEPDRTVRESFVIPAPRTLIEPDAVPMPPEIREKLRKVGIGRDMPNVRVDKPLGPIEEDPE